MCPFCQSARPSQKKGCYVRPSDQKRLQRFRCPDCQKSYSEQIFGIEYRLRKRWINQAAFRILCSGVSQRRCAFQLNVRPAAIARRILRFGRCAEHNLTSYREQRPKATVVLIDEMESFEHTKCKPLTMPIAVEEGSRKILSLRVGSIAAKGHLAAISRQRYGPRRCERKKCLSAVLNELKGCLAANAIVKSDESQHYPQLITKLCPQAIHKRYKGRRACVVGQGELKRGGFDPLFSLNHTYAMIRDNLKRLSRRTWCTSKRPDRLQLLLYIYAWFHNLWLDRKQKAVKLCWLDGPN